MIDVETTEAFLKVLEYLSEKFGLTVDWTSQNIVPYLQTLGDKIVAYERSIAWLWLWVGIAIAIVGVVFCIIGCIRDWDGFQWIILAVGIIICGVMVVFNLHTIIACDTFPEKVILDYIEEIMNTTSNTRY